MIINVQYVYVIRREAHLHKTSEFHEERCRAEGDHQDLRPLRNRLRNCVEAEAKAPFGSFGSFGSRKILGKGAVHIKIKKLSLKASFSVLVYLISDISPIHTYSMCIVYIVYNHVPRIAAVQGSRYLYRLGYHGHCNCCKPCSGLTCCCCCRVDFCCGD